MITHCAKYDTANYKDIKIKALIDVLCVSEELQVVFFISSWNKANARLCFPLVHSKSDSLKCTWHIFCKKTLFKAFVQLSYKQCGDVLVTPR